VPDPDKRHQTEGALKWATAKLKCCEEEGLSVEAEQAKHVIRNCKAELREMDMIENYRKDEKNQILIQIDRPQGRGGSNRS
jgi:hypothetical protein